MYLAAKLRRIPIILRADDLAIPYLQDMCAGVIYGLAFLARKIFRLNRRGGQPRLA